MTALHKSFGEFEIKSVDEENRTFTGTASTPRQDRSKDIMVPEGAKFKVPMPLLFHHDMRQPIGHVTKAKVTANGIEVELHIPEIKEDGRLKERVEEAYQSLKYKLVKGLSVGFLPDWDKAEMLKGGGIQFDEWEWYELSLVTIPDNRDTEVSSKKAFEAYKAALGNKPQTVVDSDLSQQKHVIVKIDSLTKGGVKL